METEIIGPANAKLIIEANSKALLLTVDGRVFRIGHIKKLEVEDQRWLTVPAEKQQFITDDPSDCVACVVEESGEVLKAIGKIMRFGMRNQHAHRPPNNVKLRAEVNDLIGACFRLLARMDRDKL